MVSIAPRRGLDAHGIGTGIGFRQAQGADVIAGAKRREIFLLLLLRAVGKQVVATEIGVGAVGKRHGGKDPGNLFHNQSARQDVRPGPAVGRIDRDAEHAQRAQLLPHAFGPSVFPVDFLGNGF
jgi:hypothetical protein